MQRFVSRYFSGNPDDRVAHSPIFAIPASPGRLGHANDDLWLEAPRRDLLLQHDVLSAILEITLALFCR